MASRRLFGLASVPAFAVLALVVLAITVRAATANATSTDYLPNINLRDQFNHQLSLASLRGKPALVGFIHTSCGGVCQLMTAKMKTIAQDFDPAFGSKLTLVSITTDPREDGPAQLNTYAKNQAAMGEGWVFLTGKPANIKRVLKLYNVAQNSDDDEMTHVFDLFLISSDGRELHHYHGSDIQPKNVVNDIRTALAAR